MSEQFDSIMEGLTDLLEYTKGDITKGRSRVIEVEDLTFKCCYVYEKDSIG
jgi:hypothetical protein